jgi:ectoine hydroxylase-related dioxygenase (phytanoyl-CoA dioxygenase family)
MGQAMRNDIDQIVGEVEESGVCIVPNFISADLLGRIRDDLDRLNDLERRHGVAFLESDGANQRVFNLVNKGEVFEEIVQHPDVMAVMDKLLGGDFILSGFSSNTTGPGGEEMTLHSDSGYVLPPHPEYLLSANAVWMIDDFTEENGGTRYVPGSHKLRTVPDSRRNYETVPIRIAECSRVGKADTEFHAPSPD